MNNKTNMNQVNCLAVLGNQHHNRDYNFICSNACVDTECATISCFLYELSDIVFNVYSSHPLHSEFLLDPRQIGVIRVAKPVHTKRWVYRYRYMFISMPCILKVFKGHNYIKYFIISFIIGKPHDKISFRWPYMTYRLSWSGHHLTITSFRTF